MTETTPPEGGDPLRRHTEDPAEGADTDERTEDEPREHPEEPAEG